ncbi:hypothetical protein DFH11DRAFT_11997 [Phellopilus nigrolimitatus]|nr:hypothetical protein DFH11DRAFT_11997 [Phellopilus nigrolimitatus]
MSSPDASQPPLNAFGAIWGPPLISTFVAAVIYGISVLQTFYYYTHYGSSDRITWRVLVATIFVLDSTAMGLLLYCLYYYLVVSWGLPEMPVPDIKEFPSEYFITTVLVFIVQGYYINIIRALRPPLIIPIFLFLISLLALGSGFILPIIQLRLKYMQVIVDNWLNHTAFNVARGSALGCDLGIATTLCWLFWRRKTDVRRTDNMLNTLIIFSVQRGVLQAVVQAGEVISYAVDPTGIYFLPFHVIVSRIYCTSLLATLNSRDYVASKAMQTHEREHRRRLDDVEKDDEPDLSTPPGLGAFEARRRSAGGRLASVMSATRPVFTSFLEPPFLESSSGPDGAGSRSQSRLESSGLGGNRPTRSGTGASLPPGILQREREKSQHENEDGLDALPELQASTGSTGSINSARKGSQANSSSENVRLKGELE